jgi:hypothetical protein
LVAFTAGLEADIHLSVRKGWNMLELNVVTAIPLQKGCSAEAPIA